MVRMRRASAPRRGVRQVAREAAVATRERAEQRVREAMGGDAHLLWRDVSFFWKTGSFPTFVKYASPSTSTVFASTLRAATLTITSAPRFCHAGTSTGSSKPYIPAGALPSGMTSNKPGELEVAPHHAAHDDVLHVRRERRQDRELDDVLLLAVPVTGISPSVALVWRERAGGAAWRAAPLQRDEPRQRRSDARHATRSTRREGRAEVIRI